MATAKNEHSRETADREGLERFTLHAKDRTAPSTICDWIVRNIETAPEEKLREALECAIEMRNYSPRKMPD